MPVKKRGRRKDSTFYDRVRRPSASTARRANPKGRTEEPKAKRRAITYDKNLVFVGMAFRGEGMEEAFGAIRETCQQLKLKARRVYENTSSGFIVLEIVDLIEKAEFIVFDLTYERPNVYYELGYAHGVGNSPTDILLVARDGSQLHFDIAALRVRFYTSTEDLRRIVKENLSGMIKASRAE